MTNAEVIKLCGSLGVDVKSHSSGMVEAQADRVRRKAESEGLTSEPKEEKTPSKKKSTEKVSSKKTVSKPSGEDSNNKKKITIANLPVTSDASAVHVDAANEITAITEKTTIANADEFIIEDSGDSGNKKSIKRKAIIDPIVVSTASTATLTIDADVTDLSVITAQSEALAIGATTGTPVNGQKLIIRVKDDGTGRAITWNAIFRAIGVTLPTTTTASKILYVGCIYNGVDSKWDAIAVKEEA